MLEAFALGEEAPEQDHVGTLVDNEAICNVGGVAIDAFRVRSPCQCVAGRGLCIRWNPTTTSACPFREPGALSRKGLYLTHTCGFLCVSFGVLPGCGLRGGVGRGVRYVVNHCVHACSSDSMHVPVGVVRIRCMGRGTTSLRSRAR